MHIDTHIWAPQQQFRGQQRKQNQTKKKKTEHVCSKLEIFYNTHDSFLIYFIYVFFFSSISHLNFSHSHPPIFFSSIFKQEKKSNQNHVSLNFKENWLYFSFTKRKNKTTDLITTITHILSLAIHSNWSNHLSLIVHRTKCHSRYLYNCFSHCPIIPM